MPDWLAVIILGIIEGITEFLPISSTGHLLIVEQWLPRQTDLFNVVIQSGAVIAVIPLFPERIRQVLFHWREKPTQDFILKAALAFFITGVGGLVLTKLHFELPEEVLPVALALIAGGVLFIVLEHWVAKHQPGNEVTWLMACAVGVGQLVAAVFPGASRSGTTILIMLALGLSRPAATEFSFLVGIPTMLSAGGLKVFLGLREAQQGGPGEDWALLALGMVTSAIVSFIAVKWLLRYVQTHTFIPFGWYRIILGVALLILFWA